MTIAVTDIEFKPRAIEGVGVIRGDREVWIKGECWCWVQMSGHGARGNSYDFRSLNGSAIEKANGVAVKVWSDKSERRRAPTETVVRSQMERVKEMAAQLVNDGLLKHPSVYTKARDDHRRLSLEREARAIRRHTWARLGFDSLLKRTDLTDYEAYAVATAYNKMCHETVEDAAILAAVTRIIAKEDAQ